MRGSGERCAADVRLGRRAQRIFFASRDATLARDSGDPFLAAALPVAMHRGMRSLLVGDPLSPKLAGSLPELQRRLRRIEPSLRRVRVKAEAAPAAEGERAAATAAFFTAGVDSFYTALRHRDELDALVFVHGFDVPQQDSERRRLVVAGVRAAAEGLGLPLIEVETNLRALARRRPPWSIYHGAALASVALTLAPSFGRVLIPATHALADDVRWGSRPDLDPLWSTERVELVHDGPVPRPQKLALLVGSEVAMATLRVCFQPGAEYNCGACSKCLRTMASLRAIGALGRCRTLPSRLSLRALGRLPIANENVAAFALQNLRAAEAAGDRRLARALRRQIRRGPLRARLDDRRRRLARALSRRLRGARRRPRRARGSPGAR